MDPFEIIPVDQPVIACDGNGGVNGHPRVYLNLAPAGAVECPYCSRRFVLRRAMDGHAVASPASEARTAAAGARAHAPPAAPAKP